MRAQLPFVTQSSDHISIVPGYDAFNISSEGVGDIALVADSIVRQSLNNVWKVGAGVSLPAGSIDEAGDTPHAPRDQQLTCTMQLGSGTWDWGVDASYTLRTGKNDRDYRWATRPASRDG